MDVSVIMPTRDKARFLERTLESLIRQETASSYEIVVIDNGSRDETADVLERYRRLDPRVSSRFLAEPGRAAARNLGIAAARGEIILFIDDDCICPPDLIQAHVDRQRTPDAVVLGARREVFSVLPADADLVAAVGPAAAAVDHSVTAAPAAYERVCLWDIWDIRHRFDAIVAASGLHENAARAEHLDLIATGASVSPWLSFLTCHASVPAALCREVGAFDDGFLGWGEEDTELGYRLWRAGATFQALTGTPVYHQVHPRAQSDATRDWFDNYRHAAAKHPGPDWRLRWRLSLGYLTHLEYEETIRAVRAGDQERAATIDRQYETFVRMWPKMRR
ncbi:hypothetical protein Acy02nite_88890 [Actinoplanes cyaneus]|uniref:Glycosyltransferase n=1 Tax=Actinoplanes cyaneus TaxID=52696 RepID=A0A919IWE0_9ACTN|nr:glycosyltransferase family 2 protein [Actinoplanes cyaneus]MCW2144279.1 N-terminal domain of galactosyltransferase [Actinoplanes cyaneus]GID71008.1 hypothetical protein Acy02nite_88890 [Actinoplanes cyaneus]